MNGPCDRNPPNHGGIPPNRDLQTMQNQGGEQIVPHHRPQLKDKGKNQIENRNGGMWSRMPNMSTQEQLARGDDSPSNQGVEENNGYLHAQKELPQPNNVAKRRPRPSRRDNKALSPLVSPLAIGVNTNMKLYESRALARVEVVEAAQSWFNTLTREMQSLYLKLHPKSRYGLGIRKEAPVQKPKMNVLPHSHAHKDLARHIRSALNYDAPTQQSNSTGKEHTKWKRNLKKSEFHGIRDSLIGHGYKYVTLNGKHIFHKDKHRVVVTPKKHDYRDGTGSIHVQTLD